MVRANRSAISLAIGILLTSSACILKKPPDAETLKKEALPTADVPAAWKAQGAGAGAITDNYVPR